MNPLWCYVQHSPVHLPINWSWILLTHKIFSLKRLYSGPTVLKKLLLGKKGNFPFYPRQKLVLLSFLLVKHHVLYGLSLVRRVGLVREQLNIMIRICLLFRVGDLSAPEIVNAEFLTSEKYFTNARADHGKRTVPSVEECNSSSMGFAWGLMRDSK